ncbi:hypothetical protein M440DRAFT_1452655, partial [Trichoderma longibrachiatum ATCC 18648]
ISQTQRSSEPPSDGLSCEHAIVKATKPVIGPLAAGNGDILCVFGVYKTGTMRAKAGAISGKGRRAARRRKTAFGGSAVVSSYGTLVIFCLVGQGSAALQPNARPGLASYGHPLGTTLPVLALALAFSSTRAVTFTSANQRLCNASPLPARDRTTFFG